MYRLKIYFYLLAVIFLAGCSVAKGPIKGYAENAAVDTETLGVIYLPPEIELLEVDGRQTKTPFISTGHNEIFIPPGMHQLALKYVAFWGDPISGSMVKSSALVVSLNIAPKSVYYCKFKTPKDKVEAEHLANNFAPWMEDAAGNKVKITINRTQANSLTSAGLSTSEEQPGPGSAPLEKLKFWWKKASFKEKKTFEGWMGNN